jgi:cytochrome c-type biogenesis protein CcmH
MSRFLKIFLMAFTIFSCVSFNAYAANNQDQDPKVEARLKALSTELRCLVCQNTTLADSDASLAEDLRNEIRELIREGKTDEEITAYLVERYGDFVRYRPPVQANTALLWFGPFVMLLIGAITLIIVLKKRSNQAE